MLTLINISLSIISTFMARSLGPGRVNCSLLTVLLDSRRIRYSSLLFLQYYLCQNLRLTPTLLHNTNTCLKYFDIIYGSFTIIIIIANFILDSELRIISFHSQKIIGYITISFKGKETEDQRSSMICLRSHSQ